MAKSSLVERFRYWLVEPHYPDVGIEVNSDSVRIAVMESSKGRIEVRHLDSEPLPSGVVEITPFKPNIVSLEPMAEALKALWMRCRFREPKVCLLLQDRSALTFHVTLEKHPNNREEALDLIRFKLRRSVPFRIEDAQIGYFAPSGSFDFSSETLWVTVMNRHVLHQYEQFIHSTIGAECGLVDLSTFNLLNVAHREISSDGDHLYVNLNRDYISIAITQGNQLMFYRSRELEGQNSRLEEALAEVYPTTIYYVDKLEGKGISQAFVYAVEDAAPLCARLQHDFGLKARMVSAQFFSGPIDVRNQRLMDNSAALLGFLASRKVEYS